MKLVIALFLIFFSLQISAQNSLQLIRKNGKPLIKPVINLGVVPLKNKTEFEFNIKNTGSSELVLISNVQTDKRDQNLTISYDQSGARNLSPGSELSINGKFYGLSTGKFKGRITLTGTDAKNITSTVTLDVIATVIEK